MNILVTGGAGFIGSHIAERLLHDGHTVTILDDLSFGHEKNIPENAQFWQGDIRGDLNGLFSEGQFDLIFHTAAQKSVRVSYNEPIEDADINILGTINLCEAARKHGVANMVFLSSGGTVYGDAVDFPTAEYAPIDAPSPYTASKIAAEVYMQYYWRQYDLHTITLRLANVYGPRQDPAGEAGVVAIFTSRLLAGEPARIYGAGTQTRDYIYIDDVTELCSMIAQQPEALEPGSYNVGTGVETSVLDVAAAVQHAIGVEEMQEHVEAVPGELQRSALDIGKIGEYLDWQPHITFGEGIQKTVQWFIDQQR